MKIPDYVAIGVLIVLIVLAAADRFPRGISEALKLRTIIRTSLRSDLIRAAQFAIGEELRTEFQAPHEFGPEWRNWQFGTVRARRLFATGLGAMGLIGWRRKRKAQVSTKQIGQLGDTGRNPPRLIVQGAR